MWLGFSLHFWQYVFVWSTIAAAVLGGLGVSAAFISAVVGYKVSDLVVDETNVRITEAQAELGKANERIAGLNAEASRLSKEAELARSQIAAANERSALLERST